MRRAARWTRVGLTLVVMSCAKGVSPPAKTNPGLTPQNLTDASGYTQEGPLPGGVSIDFRLPGPGAIPAFTDLPWPNEYYRNAAGHLTYPNFPTNQNLLVQAYVAAAQNSAPGNLDGASVASAIFFHFSGEMAAPPSDPAKTMSAGSPVFVVDIDPSSPDLGQYIPLEFRSYPTALTYVAANTLALKAVPGWVMRPGTLYAAVIRREFNDATGQLLGTTSDLEYSKWTEARPDPAQEAVRELYAPAYDYLSTLGVPRGDIAGLTIFRTATPAKVSGNFLQVIAGLFSGGQGDLAPRLLDVAWDDAASSTAPGQSFNVLVGHYCTPNFQTNIDLAPFGTGGGAIVVDPNGVPEVSPMPPTSHYYHSECGSLMKARFTLTIPTGTMPAAGWPLMSFAHGTGGSAFDPVSSDNFGGWAANQGIAVVTTDQPLHGEDDPQGMRPGSDVTNIVLNVAGVELPVPPGVNYTAQDLFYNPVNPDAGRDNGRQATADAMVLVRLMLATNFAAVGLSTEHPLPSFDVTHVLAAGHSQGSQTNEMFASLDPLPRGVLLSGCGGDLRYGILDRTSPVALGPLIATVVNAVPGELDEFHPVMTLVQGLADPVDPESYARLFREPLTGQRAKSVLHYEGMADTWNAPASAEALATALAATQLDPVLRAPIGLDLMGLAPSAVTVSANVASGAATSAFIQFNSTQGEDGHFVIYYEPGAQALAMQFLGSLASGDNPAVAGPLVP